MSTVFRQAALDKIEALEHGPREADGLKERLSFANQHGIPAVIHPNGSEHCIAHGERSQTSHEPHHHALIEAFDSGLGKKDCSEVLDIPQMCDSLAFSCGVLSDKYGLMETDVAFPGIDGSYETAWMPYVRCSTADIDRTTRSKETARKTGFSSPFSTVARYPSILPAHRWVRGLPDGDIEAILRTGLKTRKPRERHYLSQGFGVPGARVPGGTEGPHRLLVAVLMGL